MSRSEIRCAIERVLEEDRRACEELEEVEKKRAEARAATTGAGYSNFPNKGAVNIDGKKFDSKTGELIDHLAAEDWTPPPRYEGLVARCSTPFSKRNIYDDMLSQPTDLTIDPSMADNNPKRARALLDGKIPMEQIPLRALHGVARVLAGGAKKYGFRNWRVEPIAASTYVGAILRHLQEWQEGSDNDTDSGEHPLAHVIASCLLVIDAEKQGTLIDDRARSEVVGR
jgi:hypothetical protein